MPEQVVIVGAGGAGGTAAMELRRRGFDGDLVVVGGETDFPYNRTTLSKTYLRSEDSFADIQLQPSEEYAKQNIKLRLGSLVSRVDTHSNEVELETGDRLRYSKLLIATGGRNRMLPIQRTHLRGVYSLRSLKDSDQLRAEAAP